MDVRKAQFVTLWCAVISKYEKGLARSLAPLSSLNQYRVLAHLALPETANATPSHLAWAASMRPDEVAETLEALSAAGLTETLDEEDAFALTTAGAQALDQATSGVHDYRNRCLAAFSAEERAFMDDIMGRALSVPGSFYGKHAHLSPENLQPVHRMAVICAMEQAITQASKRNTGLSFTDFRFLRELYPKRPGVTKQLRARDLVARLRVGRSYVTTASLRLEAQGVIFRIPDPDDARGILFQLTPKGAEQVRATGDDIYVLLASLFGDALENRRFLVLMRRWLEGADAALVQKATDRG